MVDMHIAFVSLVLSGTIAMLLFVFSIVAYIHTRESSIKNYYETVLGVGAGALAGWLFAALAILMQQFDGLIFAGIWAFTIAVVIKMGLAIAGLAPNRFAITRHQD